MNQMTAAEAHNNENEGDELVKKKANLFSVRVLIDLPRRLGLLATYTIWKNMQLVSTCYFIALHYKRYEMAE